MKVVPGQFLVKGCIPVFLSICDVVDFPAVKEDVAATVRPVGAVGAAPRFHPSVDLQMFPEFVRQIELLLTQVTCVFLLEVVRAPNVVDQPPTVIERLATLVTKHCSLSACIVMFGVVYVQLELEGETLPALIAQNVVGNDVVVALEVERHSFRLLEDLKTLAADARLLRSSVCLHVVLVEINFLVLVVGGVSRTLGTLDLGVIEVRNPLPVNFDVVFQRLEV